MGTADEREVEIVLQARELFMTYGIKSMTMDEIARRLHISKKTLYQYVSDKDDLVMRCIQAECEKEEEAIRSITHQGLNAIDENIAISHFVLKQIQQVHPSIFFDLERYHPAALMLLQHGKQDFTAEVIRNNLLKGIEEGLFRKEIDVEIHTSLWISRINVIFDTRYFPMQSFSLSEVYGQMFEHQICGLASEKGRRYYEDRIKDKLKNMQKR